MNTHRSRKKSKSAPDNKLFIYLILLIVSGASLFFFYRQKKAQEPQGISTAPSSSNSPSTSGGISGAPASVSTDTRLMAIVTPAALSYAAKDGFSTEDFQIKSALVTKSTNSAGAPVSTVTIKHKSARCEMVLEFVGLQTKPASSNVYCK